MTHNYLFTLYALLIYFTIRFYKQPKTSTVLLLGALRGLATITRPTELISVMIPFIWALNVSSKSAVIERFNFLKEHFLKIIGAVIVVILVGCIQLIYWKYVGGDWIIYSYEDQGFNWLKPYIYECLFSYKAGWLVYTQIMVFALLGFIPLFFTSERYFLGSRFSLLFLCTWLSPGIFGGTEVHSDNERWCRRRFLTSRSTDFFRKK